MADFFSKGEIVWVLPWESTSESWPLGFKVIGIICSDRRKAPLVGEVYDVILDGRVKEISRDSLEKLNEKEVKKKED